jgi:lincosamide nucleotidyltransferase A/C/D/E
MMDSITVVNFLTSCERTGISIRVDGGWGVDALLGKQTRPHNDLDIFVQQKDIPALRSLLEKQGYKEIKLEIARPHNFVLGDDEGHEIDIHVIVFDGRENFTYGPDGQKETFPASALSGTGVIDSRAIRCTSPEWMVKWHTGYKLRETDFKDVPALCEKFGIEYPPEYAHLKS